MTNNNDIAIDWFWMLPILQIQDVDSACLKPKGKQGWLSLAYQCFILKTEGFSPFAGLNSEGKGEK